MHILNPKIPMCIAYKEDQKIEVVSLWSDSIFLCGNMEHQPNVCAWSDWLSKLFTIVWYFKISCQYGLLKEFS